MTVTPAPTIDALPPAPARSDTPADFVQKADAFAAALPPLVTQTNAASAATQANASAAEVAATAAQSAQTAAESAASAAVMATTYAATSSTSLSLTAGAKAISFAEAGRTFANGDSITLVRRSNRSHLMTGTASLVDNVARTMTVTIPSGSIVGSGGPYADWLVILDPLSALAIATAAEVLSSSGRAVLTADAIDDALEPVTLTDAATVTPDMAQGRRFVLPKTTNGQLANPINCRVGQTIEVRAVQDGTGGRTLSYGSAWKRRNGAQALSTAAGAVDYIKGTVEAVSGGVATELLYDLIKAPTA